MSTKDLSILSYKELQALAVEYRVPGNIKKLLLVKILNAVKSGDKSEVTRLLADLKKNRKKRTKRLKVMKTEDNNKSLQMPLNNSSPDMQMPTDHYLFPIQQQQQQYPFQWVGAEEEVGTSRYEDLKCNLSYNDLRQIVFYTAQGVYGNCDTNNNSTLLDEIMDLRTEATVSNYRSTLETSLLSTTSQQRIVQQQQIMQQQSTQSFSKTKVQQTADDSASKKMSLLLKKMLQAPAGANLGEIASPVASWSMDTFRLREPSPDNSETMTAKSDINENDEIWQDNLTSTPTTLPYLYENEQNYDNTYYRRTNNTSYYRSALETGIEQNTPRYENQQLSNQYQFNFAPQVDAQENCRSWLASSNLDIPNPSEFGTSSNLMPTTPLQYQTPENVDTILRSSEESSNILQTNNQYCLNTDQLYTNPGSLALEPTEIVPDLHYDESRYYDTTPLIRPEETQDYYRQLCVDTPSFSQDFYDSQQPQQNSNGQNQQSRYSDYSQQFVPATSNEPIYHIELENNSYEPAYYQEQQQQQQPQASDVPNHPVAVVDPLQQVQDQQYETYTAPVCPSNAQTNAPPVYGSAVLDSYWPRWTYTHRSNLSKTGGRSLENTLNLCTPNYVDYSKLNETSCVYSNKTPVMTLRKGLNSVPSEASGRSTTSTSTEQRSHNFASNWLLYNDETNADNINTRSILAQPPISLPEYSLVDPQNDTII